MGSKSVTLGSWILNSNDGPPHAKQFAGPQIEVSYKSTAELLAQQIERWLLEQGAELIATYPGAEKVSG